MATLKSHSCPQKTTKAGTQRLDLWVPERLVLRALSRVAPRRYSRFEMQISRNGAPPDHPWESEIVLLICCGSSRGGGARSTAPITRNKHRLRLQQQRRT